MTRPARIASDLLYDHEDPGAVAQIVADAIRNVFDYPGTFAERLAPHAGRFGLRRNDGSAMLHSLLDLVGDDETTRWMQEARNPMRPRQTDQAPTPTLPRPGSPDR